MGWGFFELPQSAVDQARKPIAANRLEKSYARKLHASVRDEFKQLVDPVNAGKGFTRLSAPDSSASPGGC
jgi:hypothetical protein